MGAGGEPASASPAEAAAPPEPVDDVVEAWHRYLDAGCALPAGLSAFLMSATVREEGGVLVLRPIPGPAYERMTSPAVLDALRRGLARWYTGRPELAVEPPAESGPDVPRITRDEVERDTLQALFRQEPRLERAVLELDLELMD